jgi:type III restriction enzyme
MDIYDPVTNAIRSTEAEKDDQDSQKYQVAQLWVTAVNHWGRLGGWDFTVCRDSQMLPVMLARMK